MRGALLVMFAACAPPSPPVVARSTVPTPRSAPPRAPAVPIELPKFLVPPPNDPVIQIASGLTYGCAVRASGAVDCWGTWEPSFTSHPEIRRLPISDAIAADAGRFDLCVLTKHGVVCTGLLGDLVPIAGTADAVELAGNCARTRAGAVTCWGPNNTTPTPTHIGDAAKLANNGCVVHRNGHVSCNGDVIPQLEHVVALAIGHDEQSADDGVWAETLDGCALLANSSVRCFTIVHRNDAPSFTMVPSQPKQTGNGDPWNPHAFGLASALVGVTAIALDEDNTLTALVKGRVIVVARGASPRTLASLDDAVAISTRCALRAQGSVVCWGSNTHGALAQRTTLGTTFTTPVPIVGLAGIRQLALGYETSWGLDDRGQVYRWGDYTSGWPVAVPEYQDITLIAKAPGVSELPCMARKAGGLVCLRRDDKPIELAVGTVAKIAPTNSAFLVLRTDGTAVGWDDIYGKEPYVPRPIPGVVDAIDLVGSPSAYCFLDRKGDVSCMHAVCTHEPQGWNCVDVPPAKLDLHDVTALASSGYVYCALQRSGQVQCWGSNVDLQLGHGGPNSNVPTPVPGVDHASAIAVSVSEGCAIQHRELTCWGKLDIPNSGAGYAKPAAAPHSIPISDDVAIAMADWTTCLISRDRLGACFGFNSAGELGDGSVVLSDEPVGIPLE